MLDTLKRLLPGPPDPDAPQPWNAQRRTPRACDLALTGTTRRWLRQLPARRRPLRLCMLYPRVANRIAWCWPDEALCSQMLQDLLFDGRGGRQGFPPAVERELRRLREFHMQHRVETAPETFWARARRLAGLA